MDINPIERERQRVAACRTLPTRPHLLFADEPVSSLDPILAAEVLPHLKVQFYLEMDAPFAATAYR